MCRILVTSLALTFLLNLNVAAADSTSSATPKSKCTALAHSLAWTLVPGTAGVVIMSGNRNQGIGFGVTSLGIILGPGAGHAYAGEMRRFWVGAAVRSLVLSSSILIAVTIVQNSHDDTWDVGLSKLALAATVGCTGAIICIVSAIRDIKSVGKSVDIYNRNHGFADVRMKPTYFVNHKAPGVMLTLTF